MQVSHAELKQNKFLCLGTVSRKQMVMINLVSYFYFLLIFRLTVVVVGGGDGSK